MSDQKTDWNRRDFVKRSLAGLAGAGLLGASAPARTPGPAAEKTAPAAAPLQRTLGKTGLRLPVVNMGVMNADNPALLRRAYELGMRHFDTAAYYQRGRNEEMVGAVIKELGVRDKVVIATKVFVPDDMRTGMSAADAKAFYLKSAEESLRRLQTDYLDILYSHSVKDTAWMLHPGVLEALQTLKEQKKARFIGFTTHENMTALLNEAVRRDRFDVILTTFNYALYDDAALLSALQAAAAGGIGLIAMKTQCQQPWYREEYETEARRAFYKGELMHSALLKWVLRHEFITCAVPGFTNFSQLEEDFAVSTDLAYSPAERKFLEDRQVKTALQAFCRQCRQCLPSCPHGVDIPALIRVHAYAAGYANFPQAAAVFAEVPQERGLGACRSCAACRAACVRRVNIPRRIGELRQIYG